MKKWLVWLPILMLLLGACRLDEPGDAKPAEQQETQKTQHLSTPNGIAFEIPKLSESAPTVEQKTYYFEFCRKYLVNQLPVFNYAEDTVPSTPLVNHYAGLFLQDQLTWEHSTDSMQDPAYFSGETLDRFIQQRFGYSLGLDAEVRIAWEQRPHTEQTYFYNIPLCELVAYGEQTVGGRKIVRVQAHGFWGYDEGYEYAPRPYKPMTHDEQVIYAMMQEQGLTYYECLRNLILAGETDQLNPPMVLMEFSYVEQADGEPLFLSYSETPVEGEELPIIYYEPEE